MSDDFAQDPARGWRMEGEGLGSTSADTGFSRRTAEGPQTVTLGEAVGFRTTQHGTVTAGETAIPPDEFASHSDVEISEAEA